MFPALQREEPSLSWSKEPVDVVGCAAVWFVYHHFWFLDVSIGGLPLHAVCQMLILALVPAALLPGLLATGASKDLVNQQLLLQVGLPSLCCSSSKVLVFVAPLV